MTDKAVHIVRRIARIERGAIYFGMSDARTRAIRRMWRAFSRECVA
jgi:hypothetical protein